MAFSPHLATLPYYSLIGLKLSWQEIHLCVCVCLCRDGCIWMTAKLNARASKATGSQWERWGQHCTERDSGRNAGIKPRDDIETVVGRCVCVIDWVLMWSPMKSHWHQGEEKRGRKERVRWKNFLLQCKVNWGSSTLKVDEELKKNLVLFLIHSSCKLSEYEVVPLSASVIAKCSLCKHQVLKACSKNINLSQ